MKRLLFGILAIVMLMSYTICLAEEWMCSQCSSPATGNFCSNCGISAEESNKLANNESIITIGVPVVIEDICEFVINEAAFIERLNPQNPAVAYSYYEADEGKIYFCIEVSYTNLEAETVSMQGFGLTDGLINGTLIYSDRYKYTGFLCYEQDLMGMGGSMTNALMGSIDPLCTETMYYLIEVPDTVSESDDSIKIILEVGDNEYEYTAR